VWSIADQREAANIAGAAVRLLQLDAVWTAGLDDSGGLDDDAGQALADVGMELWAGLWDLRQRVPFLLGIADGLDSLLRRQEPPNWPPEFMEPPETVRHLRDAVDVVEKGVTGERHTLMLKVTELEAVDARGAVGLLDVNLGDVAEHGGRGRKERRVPMGDLGRRMRAAISIIGGTLLIGLAVPAVAADDPGGDVLGAVNTEIGCALLIEGVTRFRD
jgi:hypothetical protein